MWVFKFKNRNEKKELGVWLKKKPYVNGKLFNGQVTIANFRN
jgi:hypothetical protein